MRYHCDDLAICQRINSIPLLHRVGEVSETDRFSDNVVLASGNFIKNDVTHIIFEPIDE